MHLKLSNLCDKFYVRKNRNVELKIGMELFRCMQIKKVCRPANLIMIGSPNGIRTRVTGVRGRRPKPLDDGTICQFLSGFNTQIGA